MSAFSCQKVPCFLFKYIICKQIISGLILFRMCVSIIRTHTYLCVSGEKRMINSFICKGRHVLFRITLALSLNAICRRSYTTHRNFNNITDVTCSNATIPPGTSASFSCHPNVSSFFIWVISLIYICCQASSIPSST